MKFDDKIFQIDPFFDDDFRPLKGHAFPREKNNDNIRNYDYLNIPSEYSPYRMRLPKIRVPNIKHRVCSYSEKIFPEKYGKKEVIYDDFSKIYVSDTRSVENKRLVLNPMLSKILMTDIMKRKSSKTIQNILTKSPSSTPILGEEIKVEALDCKYVENLYEKTDERRNTEKVQTVLKSNNIFIKSKRTNYYNDKNNKDYVFNY